MKELCPISLTAAVAIAVVFVGGTLDARAQEPGRSSPTQAIAETFLGLLVDSQLSPERNAVDAYAVAFDWEALPDEMSELFNAKRSYAGTLGGSTVVMGTDGSNEIWALAVADAFDPAGLLKIIGRVLVLERVGSNESIGQITEAYQAKDKSSVLGFITFTYGSDASLAGAGTLGFLSAERAAAEGIGQ